MDQRGFETPEEAALNADSGWPPGMATVVGVEMEGDHATVWLLTNDRPPFEEYEVYCERQDGRWFETHGMGGFGVFTPKSVRRAAAEIIARFD